MACRQDRRRRASEKSKTHLWIVLGRSPRVLALISAHGGVRIRHPNWRVSQACGQEEAKRVANALVGGIFLVESMYSAGMSEAMTAGRSSRASTCTRDIQIDAQNTSSWMLRLSPLWLPDDPVLQQSRMPREAHAKRRNNAHLSRVAHSSCESAHHDPEPWRCPVVSTRHEAISAIYDTEGSLTRMQLNSPTPPASSIRTLQ